MSILVFKEISQKHLTINKRTINNVIIISFHGSFEIRKILIRNIKKIVSILSLDISILAQFVARKFLIALFNCIPGEHDANSF